MKAIVQDVYGPADVLALRDLDRPSVGDDEVLVRVRAAGVDPGVWHLMTGRPYLLRAVGFGLRRPKVPVRGRDLAGVVEAVGARVTRLRPGDEVYGTCESGSFAEYATARQDRLAIKPANLSFEQAAVTPISGMTALQGLRDCAGLRPGQRVMVIGAAGGVGSFAVQIAKAFGATVTGVCTREGRPRRFPRRRRRPRLHPQPDRRQRGTVRRHHRHGGQPSGIPAAARPDARRNPGPGRRRAWWRPATGRLRPTDAARTAHVHLHQSAPAQPDGQGARRRPRGTTTAHRLRRRHPRHRPHLPPRRRRRRDPPPRSRPRRRKDRRHRIGTRPRTSAPGRQPAHSDAMSARTLRHPTT